ncbi:MAG: hypothetical protein KAQ98_08810 [Bacteriovoracaceae bacterium]|nr:hypothetical protein [Bacteriovoracaceae bacterium]
MDDFNGVLGDVFSDVLNKSFFMFAEKTDEVADQENFKNWFQVSIDFKWRCSGSISCFVTEKMCMEMAENVVCSDGQNEIIEPVKEMMNMVCGNFLSSIAREADTYQIMLPRHDIIHNLELKEIQNSSDAQFFLVEDSYPMVLKIIMNSESEQK